MPEFTTVHLSPLPVASAPDGTDVRLLGALPGGSMAHFTLAPGKTSLAVAHRTVDEVWLFLAGRGEMWRRQDGREEIEPVAAGVSVTVPLGTAFQFRAFEGEPLVFVAITMPPWPGADEAFAVEGAWEPTVGIR
jgi:mannose-6-phosphate isomerase-like protein (cupin superfamily)